MKTKKILFVYLFFFNLLVILFFIGCQVSHHTPRDIVTISNKSTYFEVVINLEGNTHKKIGEELGTKILESVPNIEILLDSYLAEIPEDDYGDFLTNAANIKSQLPQDYRDEIDGIASKICTGTIISAGDSKLTVAEFYLVNLYPDAARTYSCSAVSAFGSTSSTGKTITARNLDWYGGFFHQLEQIQAVTTIKNGSKSVCLIGYLGFMGTISGFNNDKVFAAILDSPIMGPYSSTGKNSYPFDIRYALENYTTLDEVANYMIDSSRHYTYGHLVFLSDPAKSKVVENDLSDDSNRKIRDKDSELNLAVTPWPASLGNSIGSVNSFVLSGNNDNHSVAEENYARWDAMISQMGSKMINNSIDVAGIKQVISFDNGDGPDDLTTGDIYWAGTQQSIIFQPDTLSLEIYFKPKSGILDHDPVYQTVPVNF
jgi:hypothetical protein